MGNCIAMKLRDGMRSAWNKIRCRKRRRKSIVLLVVGLDNAGKSAIVNYIFNKSLLTKENVVPTIGFRTVSFNYKSYSIRIYDIGGGPQIRALWPKYYADVHGVIFVVDSSDHERLHESTAIFQDLVCHELITQKPVLFLGNKHDLEDAIHELDLIEFMNIEHLVNFAKCYTRVEVCSCYPDKRKRFNLNKCIDEGFEWLVEEIDDNYEYLEEELVKRKSSRRLRRSFTLKSWSAQSYNNSFAYSDSDSDLYLKPIIPNIPPKKKKRRKRKSLKSIFCISKNRTAPMPDDENNIPTTKSMQELIRSMRIEDLIRNTEVDAHAVSEYRRPWIRRKKRRPKTAPAAAKPFELNPIQRAEPIAQILP